MRAFLAEVERLPSAVFIEGEAGIGKTTLWRAGTAEAQEVGYRVLSARPAEAESQVSYAGLRDLFDPVLELVVAELPPPQRRALEIALLLREAEEDAPDQAAIAFAVLGALRAIADTPVLVAVDDLQGEKLLRLIETLNESDDVQNVYANFKVSDALIAKMSA